MCEIEISHMGKNNGNPDLVCEKKVILSKNIENRILNLNRYGSLYFDCNEKHACLGH